MHPQTRAFLFATQFLSRIPVTGISAPDADDQSRAALYYPAVGLCIGVLMIGIVFLLSRGEPLLVSAVVVVFWAIITGALHIDGLADSADAWLGGGASINKTHEILKDPLLGTAGATAISCIFLIKYSALFSLVKQDNYVVIMLAPVIGRAMILLLFCSTRYVRKQGLVSAIIQGLNRRAALITVSITLLTAGWFSLAGVIGVLVIFLALRNIMIKRLGGFTGDTTGATVEITEASWLLAAALA